MLKDFSGPKDNPDGHDSTEQGQQFVQKILCKNKLNKRILIQNLTGNIGINS